MKPGWILEKVVSGAQTGVDQVALEVAQELGYQTGGWAPWGYMTDVGPMPELQRKYGVLAHRLKGYRPRTMANVYDSDATVLFGDMTSVGCTCTREAILRYHKLSLENPTVSELQAWILEYTIRVLNVAGNRLRTNPAASAQARVILRAGLLPF